MGSANWQHKSGSPGVAGACRSEPWVRMVQGKRIRQRACLTQTAQYVTGWLSMPPTSVTHASSFELSDAHRQHKAGSPGVHGACRSDTWAQKGKGTVFDNLACLTPPTQYVTGWRPEPPANATQATYCELQGAHGRHTSPPRRIWCMQFPRQAVCGNQRKELGSTFALDSQWK